MVQAGFTTNILDQQSRLAQSSEEFALDLGESFAGERRPRDDNQVQWLCQGPLIQPEHLAHQSPYAIACNRATHFAGSDDPEPRSGPGRHPLPVGDQATGRAPLAPLAEAGEIPALFDARSAAEGQARWLVVGHPAAVLCGGRT